MSASEFPAPGEWQSIGPTTSVMEVIGGCVMKEEISEETTVGLKTDMQGYAHFEKMRTPTAVAICFIPYRNEALEKAMERWIRQAVERQKGEK